MMSLKLEQSVLLPEESVIPLNLWFRAITEPQLATARIHPYSDRGLPVLPPGGITPCSG
jgi:hypothetical protein